jgi:hypothetical protein
MPIKPENKSRYPEDWPERRARVLNRAGNRCELCGARNKMHIARVMECPALWLEVESGEGVKLPLSGHPIPWNERGYHEPIKVILTVAHLDPTYQSHEEKHLLALCQRCHLKIDAPLRGRIRK